ncbi:MAG: hypothetical protein AB1631_33360 [Acidobacteriota bacterium]
MLAPPFDVEMIFARPGREWAEVECERVRAWLNGSPQLGALILFAAYHLGRGASIEDAEQAWVAFNESGLDNVIANYDSAKSSFCGNLLYSFNLFCRLRRSGFEDGFGSADSKPDSGRHRLGGRFS